MVKILLFITLLISSSVLYGQETLQSVVDRGNTSTREIIVKSPSTDNYVYLGGTYEKATIGAFNFNTGPTDLILQGIGGNIGMGTTNPEFKLHVNGTVGILNGMRLAGDANFGQIVGRVGKGLNFYTNDGVSNPLTLSSAGNVGIGIAAPQDKLDVDGTITSGVVSIGHKPFLGAKNLVSLGSDNHGTLLLGSNIFTSNEGSTPSVLKIAKSHGSLAGAGIVIPGNAQDYQGSIIFHSAPPTSVLENQEFSSPRMIIDENGLVGIGTLTPRELLSVNGKIRAKEIKVETANWPDYVFYREHKLTPLEDVESYIKTNNHLPEIPSAIEVTKEGISLGEMNAKLLKKIEELTLYLIEQNKELKEIKSSNERLETEVSNLKSRL
mgnify:CR=1 FL=1